MGSPAVLVTGANKGIGFEIVRQLGSKFQGTVYLTARNVERGQAAENELQKEGLSNVKFLQMDVTDKKTIERARDAIKEKHGGLDILVNNAGIYIGNSDTDWAATSGIHDPSADAVKTTMATNFTGLLNVCEIFFPILRAHARIVNVSSSVGTLRFLKISHVKNRLASNDLTVSELKQIVADYIRAAEQGKAVELGYPDQHGAYAMSKIAVTALSRVQQRVFDADNTRSDIVVNACCPGYVATDINHGAGLGTVKDGADTPIYLALLPPSDGTQPVKPRGEFVYERRVYDWASEEVADDVAAILFK